MSFATITVEQTARNRYVAEVEIGGAVCKKRIVVADSAFELLTGIGAAMHEMAPELHPDLEHAAKAWAELHPPRAPQPPVVQPQHPAQKLPRKAQRSGEAHMVGED